MERGSRLRAGNYEILSVHRIYFYTALVDAFPVLLFKCFELEICRLYNIIQFQTQRQTAEVKIFHPCSYLVFQACQDSSLFSAEGGTSCRFVTVEYPQTDMHSICSICSTANDNFKKCRVGIRLLESTASPCGQQSCCLQIAVKLPAASKTSPGTAS